MIGIGCMRLSTERNRDERAAIAVLHAAFDAGITLLDTADAYCWVDLIHRYHLEPAACIYVGDGPQDPGFARRLGLQIQSAHDFFGAAFDGRARQA